MNEQIIGKLIDSYGMTGFISLMLFMIIRWVLNTNRDREKAQAVREDRLMQIIADHKNELANHAARSNEYQQEHRQAHQFQRDEHARQIDILNKIVDKCSRHVPL